MRYEKCRSLGSAFAECECFEYAFALADGAVALVLPLDLPLQLGQPAHDDVLHLVGPVALRLALHLEPLDFDAHLPVLLLVPPVALLQLVHLLQQQLVLQLQVLVLALQDALDVRVLRQLLRTRRVPAGLFLVL